MSNILWPNELLHCAPHFQPPTPSKNEQEEHLKTKQTKHFTEKVYIYNLLLCAEMSPMAKHFVILPH